MPDEEDYETVHWTVYKRPDGYTVITWSGQDHHDRTQIILDSRTARDYFARGFQAHLPTLWQALTCWWGTSTKEER